MKNQQARRIAALGMLTAIVIVLQLLGSFIRFGTFSVSLVLVPIVIGAVLYGPGAGAWLGFVFGVVVLLSGDAAAFLSVNPIGTVVTVLTKGICAGLVSGWISGALRERNLTLGVILAALACPVVNTGLFLAACPVFFWDTISEWAMNLGFRENVVGYMFVGLAGGNFLFELAVNLVLAPVIIRIIALVRKK